MGFSLAALLLAPCAVLLAYLVFAVGGFGSALVSIPMLALLLPVKVVIPLVVLLDFVAAFSTGLRSRRDVEVPEMLALIPAMLVGLVLGVALLVKLPAQAVLIALGSFILGYGLYSYVYHDRRRAHSRRWAWPTGLLGGLIGGMFGTGGPVYVIYLNGRIDDAARLRATLSMVFSVSTAVRLLLFVFSGLLLQKEVWLAALYLAPAMLAALFIGQRIRGRLSRSQISRVVSALLVASGASVLWKAV